jgi:predicted HAD superfamily phosphohydrolase YqeG
VQVEKGVPGLSGLYTALALPKPLRTSQEVTDLDLSRATAVGFDLFNTLITMDGIALRDAVESLVSSLMEAGLKPD